MAYQLPEKVTKLTPYTPITGSYPIRLDANESFVSPSGQLLEELQQAAAGVAFSRYPDPYATGLCAAFARLHRLSPDLVTAGNGSDELIGILCGSLLPGGSVVLGLAPDFSMYGFYANLYGHRWAALPKQESLQVDFDLLLAEAKARKAAMIILSNPCNPTSLGESRENILRLAQELPQTLVVADEAYMEFYNQSVIDCVEQYDNLIVLRTCSKAVGLASLRLGFAVCGPVLTGALRAVKSPYNVNAVSQAMGEVVLSKPNYLQDCIGRILRSRDRLQSEIGRLAEPEGAIRRVLPSCANFVFARCIDAPGLAQGLQAGGVVVRQMGDYLRITAGSEQENEALLTLLTKLRLSIKSCNRKIGI